MYNETLKYIKGEYAKKNPVNFELSVIRKILKDKRDQIVKESGNKKKEQIKVHDID